MKYIYEDDIDKNNIRISTNVIHLDKYDMYYVHLKMKNGTERKVRVFCEKGTMPDIDSNLFRRYQRNYGKELGIFFVKRLLGPNGLMAKEGRDDYIYLGGEFLKDGCVANRGMIQENGKTGQQNFDDNFFKIKMQVEARENQGEYNSSNEKGKHYVLGDIHGMYGSYMEAMKRLTTKDHLYIIGDVIDRGNGGIKILQDIMRRVKNPENNPKITFLMGNHEMLLMKSIVIMNDYGLNKKDIKNIINRKNIKGHVGALTIDKKPESQIEPYRQELDKYEKACGELMNETGIDKYDIKYLEGWLTNNRGYTTVFNYLDCDEKEKAEIYTFLYNAYVVLPQTIENRDYLFVHAMPPKNEEMISRMKETGKGYRMSELTYRDFVFMLETREDEDSTYENAKRYGFTTICGHDAELGNIVKDKKKGYIRIDTGCGHKQRRSKLALYCIEDDKVQYIDEREENEDLQNNL